MPILDKHMNARTLFFTLSYFLIAYTLLGQNKVDTLYFDNNGTEVKKTAPFLYYEVRSQKRGKLDGTVYRVYKNRLALETINYKKGKLDGEYYLKQLADSTITKGMITKGLREGEWTITDLYGTPYYTENYTEGVLKDRSATEEIIAEAVESDTTLNSSYNTESWNRHLVANLRYPREATRNGYEGEVWHDFIVLKNGKPSNLVWTNKGEVNEVLAAEAKRVILLYNYYQPIYKNGASIATKKKIRIVFRLK
ncbi:TonB-like protein [Roseivirga pacifica]|uniref:TonB protein C-terminal n=2 Tax=Roseivirga pacifica TaxID=1267423 RepID=A0A1I0R4N8_9BACT|nr:TonB-like protein [Roseivirga pacifica]SEW35520.1 TonB protein C-terminal [Roseivirga pacifica]